ncbi:uncharacterized protein TNCV_3643711 [Trichonephila clavipes]|nr:uncharacterized protein TNCV_3643711 [Trichonephila clavipes]
MKARAYYAHPSMHGHCALRSTLNSCRAASPLVRFMEGEERWESPDHFQGVLPENWGGTEQNRTLPCMVLNAKVNGMRKILALSHGEFRGP